MSVWTELNWKIKKLPFWLNHYISKVFLPSFPFKDIDHYNSACSLKWSKRSKQEIDILLLKQNNLGDQKRESAENDN